MGIGVEGEQNGLLPKPASAGRWRALCKNVLIYAGSYLCCYAVLSALGTYEWTFTGKMRYGGGLPVNDVRRWSPAWCQLKTFTSIDGSGKVDADGLALLFYPLIRLDREFVHGDEFPLESAQ